MEMPTAYTSDFLGAEKRFAELCEFDWNESEYRSEFTEGFFPFLDDADSGEFGFYWAAGREQDPPIVVHRYLGCLIPVNSTLENACRFQRLTFGDEYSIPHSYRLFMIEGANDRALPAISESFFKRQWMRWNRNKLNVQLGLDPLSPFLRTKLAETKLESQSFSEARDHYVAALNLAPEYNRARLGLIWSLLQLNQLAEARLHSRLAVLNFAVGMDVPDNEPRPPFLNRIRLWKTQITEGTDDPLLSLFDVVVFNTWDTQYPDPNTVVAVYEHFVEARQFHHAAQLWKLRNVRGSSKSDLRVSAQDYFAQLIRLYELAGNDHRAALIRSAVEK